MRTAKDSLETITTTCDSTELERSRIENTCRSLVLRLQELVRSGDQTARAAAERAASSRDDEVKQQVVRKIRLSTGTPPPSSGRRSDTPGGSPAVKGDAGRKSSGVGSPSPRVLFGKAEEGGREDDVDEDVAQDFGTSRGKGMAGMGLSTGVVLGDIWEVCSDPSTGLTYYFNR